MASQIQGIGGEIGAQSVMIYDGDDGQVVDVMPCDMDHVTDGQPSDAVHIWTATATGARTLVPRVSVGLFTQGERILVLHDPEPPPGFRFPQLVVVRLVGFPRMQTQLINEALRIMQVSRSRIRAWVGLGSGPCCDPDGCSALSHMCEHLGLHSVQIDEEGCITCGTNADKFWSPRSEHYNLVLAMTNPVTDA